MAAYTDGTIGLVCNTSTIKGDGTAFLANAKVGQFVSIPGLKQIFHIKSVDSDLQLTVFETIPGPTGNTLFGLVYAIATDFTPTLNLPMPGRNHLNSQALINRGLKILDLEMPLT
jgi:hypothetical protein